MKKLVLSSLLVVLIGIFVISSVSAEILISQPSQLYNVGDSFSVSMFVKPYLDTNDFLTAKVVCDNGEIEVYKSALNIKAGESKNITLDIKLDKKLFNELSGSCFLDSLYGSEEGKSQAFELTNRVNVNLIVGNSIVGPGEQISFSGDAKKSNGQNLEGFAELNIVGTNLSMKSSVSSGQFGFNVTMPDNIAPGSYESDVRVYEQDISGNVANEGSASALIRVKQIVKSIDVAISSTNLLPGENITHSLLLYDQSGAEVKTSGQLTIYDSKGNVYANKVANVDEASLLQLPLSASPGYWAIEAKYDSLSVKRQFYVEEVENASFILTNQTLVIKNIGNVPYKKSVEVKIGDNTEVKNFNIPVDSETSLKLLAPSGQYAISVNEGANSNELGSSFLTGNAVGVKDLGSLNSDPKVIMWFWITIIVILLAIGIGYYRKVRKSPYTSHTPKFVSKQSFSNSFAAPAREKSNMAGGIGKVETYNPDVKESKVASNYVSESGAKETVAVIAIKIKNTQKLRDSESSGLLAVERLMDQARAMRAKSYEQGAFKIVVFSTKLSKKTELDNYLDSIRFATQADSALKEFNKKYAIKIDYGIGGHIGEMFFEMSEGRPKFTSYGNTIIVAKNAAEKANNELFVSSLLHRKVYNVVKGEQTQYGLYKVSSMIERSQNSEFIQRFMKKKE